jgi:hypothetical protein
MPAAIIDAIIIADIFFIAVKKLSHGGTERTKKMHY